jgi:ribose transport system ATP-binding protein
VSPSQPDPVLAAVRVSKTFPGQVALSDVSLDISLGQICGLMGHNGSGKSTLIKIMSGYYQADAGPADSGVFVSGERLPPGNPDAVRRAGLRFIHQDLGLIDELSVLDNLRLGSGTYETGALWHIRGAEERQSARRLLDRFEIDVDPLTKLADLSAVQRTEVAVARALQQEDAVRLLVLDEPTAVLPEASVQRLFRVLRAVRQQGIAVLYVSHRLEEIPQITTHVCVLRDGRRVAFGPTADFSRSRLVELITGQSVAGNGGAPQRSSGPAAGDGKTAGGGGFFELTDVVSGQLTGLTMSVDRGEVVGLAGLAGSGVHDLPECLLGRHRLVSGEVRLAGKVLARLSPADFINRRVAVLPAARPLKAIEALNVRENLTLPHLAPLWRGGRLRRREERALAAQIVRDYDIRPPDPERTLATLSGGNRQKVCVAKWLRIQPALLILDEPTAGIDVGATREILTLIRTAASQNVGVVVCSSDLQELEEICSRVLIVRGGKIAAELSGDRLTRENIIAECYRGDDDA